MYLLLSIVWFVVFLLLDVGVIVVANRYPHNEELKFFREVAPLRIIYALFWPFMLPILIGFELMSLSGKLIPRLYNMTLKKFEDRFR